MKVVYRRIRQALASRTSTRPGRSRKRPAVLTRIHTLVYAVAAALLHLASSHRTDSDGRSAAARHLDASSILSQPDVAGTHTVGRRCAASDSIANAVDAAAAELGR